MFNIGVQLASSYVLVVLTGRAGAAEIQSMNVFVGDLLKRTGRRRVLLDSFTFESALGDEGKQAVIAHMKATIPELDRVAVLVPDDSHRGFVVGAAEGREFEAAEFSNIVEAEKWLQSGEG